MNDLNNQLSVGQFLIEFGIAVGLVCALAAVWREWMRRSPSYGDDDLRLLDQYEHAWLKYGRAAAIERAVINMVRHGSLIVDHDDPQRVHLQDFVGVQHPLEIDVLNAVARYGSLQIEQIPYATLTEETPAALIKDGLVPAPGRRWWSFLPAVFVAPAILAVGGTEVWDLVAAGKPVASVVLVTVAGAFAVARLCLPTARTRRGDAVLKRLEESAPRRELASNLAIQLPQAQQQVA